jgi:5-keto 4-deoxyuronate isomerase
LKRRKNVTCAAIGLLHAVHPIQAEATGIQDMRDNFLIEPIFTPGQITTTYTHYDRLVVRGGMPTVSDLANPAEVVQMVWGDCVAGAPRAGAY